MRKSKILSALKLMLLLSAGLWKTSNAQSASVPIALLRDYNATKEDLKVARDSILILANDVHFWKDSTQTFKAAYLKERKRKRGWRMVAIILGVKEGAALLLKN